jgi:hypothetical protein
MDADTGTLLRNEWSVVLVLLRSFDPKSFTTKLPEILRLCISVNAASDQVLVDWLTPSQGWHQATTIVSRAMKAIALDPTNPFIYNVIDSGQITLQCAPQTQQAASKTSAINVIRVPYFRVDNAGSGGYSDPSTIDASVFVGDLVKLRCTSAKVWVVYELNPLEHTVTLGLYERAIRTSTRGRVVDLEKRTIYSMQLMGATVWREELSADNDSSSTITFRVPNIPFETVVKSFKELAKTQNYSDVGAGTVAKTCPSMEAVNCGTSESETDAGGNGEDGEEEVREGQEENMGTSVSDGDRDTGAGSKLMSACYRAQAETWLGRQSDIQQARTLLWQADPAASLDRDTWVLVARSLRTVCRGGGELLQDFTRWTLMGAETEVARLRGADCATAWWTLRPSTTSDLPVIAQTRVFAKSVQAAADNVRRALVHKPPRVCDPRDWSSMPTVDDCRRLTDDPALISVFDTASKVLSGRRLYFLQRLGTDSCPVDDEEVHAPGAVFVSAVIYQTQTETETETPDTLTYGLSSSSVQRTVAVPAYIAAGDIVLLAAVGTGAGTGSARSGSGHRKSDGDQNKSWHRVVDVDLLYARLRVCPCMPPPECWSDKSHSTLPSVWISVSSLWSVVVCRLISPSVRSEEPAGHTEISGVSQATRSQYQIFLTPLPSTAAAFAALHALPRKTDGSTKTAGTSKITRNHSKTFAVCR